MKILGGLFIAFGALCGLSSLIMIFAGGGSAVTGGVIMLLLLGVAPIALGMYMIKNSKKNAELRAQQRLEQLKREEAEQAERERAKQEYITNLIIKFGEDGARRVLNQTVALGDSKDFVLEAFGKPVDTDETVSKSKVKHTWKYMNTAKNIYKFKVMFENDIVVGWEDKR